MFWLRKQLISSSHQRVGLRLQDRSAALLNFCVALRQPCKERIQSLSHLRCGAKASIRRHLFPCPIPDRLVSVEVRTVGGQGYQSQVEFRRRKTRSHLRTTMGRAVVPDHHQWPPMLAPKMLQEGDRGLRGAILGHVHVRHFPCLQTKCPNSRWLSRPTWGWSSQPMPARLARPIWFADQHQPGSEPHPQKRSWLRWFVLRPARQHNQQQTLLFSQDQPSPVVFWAAWAQSQAYAGS